MATWLFVQEFVLADIIESMKSRVTGLSWGIPLVTDGFPSQRTSNAFPCHDIIKELYWIQRFAYRIRSAIMRFYCESA